MGYVYLLLEVDKNGDERHKIGYSKNNPEKRVKQLQTGNSNVISLLKSFQTENYRKLETWLHKKYGFQKTEADNEWFTLTNEQVMTFLDECKKIDEIISLLLRENPFYK